MATANLNAVKGNKQMRNFKKLSMLLSNESLRDALLEAIAFTKKVNEDTSFIFDKELRVYDSNYFVKCPKAGMKLCVTTIKQQGATGVINHYKVTVVCPMLSIHNEVLTFAEMGVTHNGVTIDEELCNAMEVTKLDKRGAHLPTSVSETYKDRLRLTRVMDDYFYDIYKTIGGTCHYIVMPVRGNEGFTGIVATAFIGIYLNISKL